MYYDNHNTLFTSNLPQIHVVWQVLNLSIILNGYQSNWQIICTRTSIKLVNITYDYDTIIINHNTLFTSNLPNIPQFHVGKYWICQLSLMDINLAKKQSYNIQAFDEMCFILLFFISDIALD